MGERDSEPIPVIGGEMIGLLPLSSGPIAV